MATYRKRGTTWLVEVRKQGIYLSASFSTKAEAREWATITEYQIAEGKLVAETVAEERRPVREAFKRYAKEVSPTKGGARWEGIRLGTLCRDPLARVLLVDLNTQHLATFRDARLRQVAPATVNRELNLISAVFNKARKE